MMKKKLVNSTFATAIVIGLVLSVVSGAIPNASAQNASISDITFSSANPSDGDEITLSVTIHNNATFPISNATLTFYVDHVVIDSISGIALEAKGSLDQAINWTAEGGTHTISAILSVNGMPLPDTEISLVIEVALGDPSTLVGALTLIVAFALITPLVPSIFEKLRGQNSGRNRRTSIAKSSKSEEIQNLTAETE